MQRFVAVRKSHLNGKPKKVMGGYLIGINDLDLRLISKKKTPHFQ